MPLAWPPATEMVTVGKFLLVLRSAAGADVARPERKISSVACRPLSGSSTTFLLSMTWPMPVERVSTIEALAVTVSCSLTAPICSVTFITGFEFTCRTMPSCTKVLKPCSVALS